MSPPSNISRSGWSGIGDDLNWAAVDVDKDADQVDLAVKHSTGARRVALSDRKIIALPASRACGK
jgi:hypothetical protein